MGWRIRRSLKIAPGVRLNLSKTGMSTSIGRRGATVNFRNGRTRTTVGIPGSGISYSSQSSGGRGRSSGNSGGGCALSGLFALPVYVIRFMFIILKAFFKIVFILIAAPFKAVYEAFRKLKTAPFSEQSFSNKITILLAFGFMAGIIFLIPTALISNAIHPMPTGTPTLVPTITFTPKPTKTGIPTATITPTVVPTNTIIPTETFTPLATTIIRSGLIPISTSTSAPITNNTGGTNWPSGATAQCKDGSYWYATARRGACSHHGGVLIWK